MDLPCARSIPETEDRPARQHESDCIQRPRPAPNVARAERGVYLERTKGVLHSRVGNSQEDPETSIPSEALWING